MPATRSRMSASSSTIRISAAMPSLGFRHLSLLGLNRFNLAGGGESHPHPGTALARNLFGSIAQFDGTAMVFDNAPDDGEAEPGALFARRDIGLEPVSYTHLRAHETDSYIVCR